MKQPSWLHGTYEDALLAVAEQALFVRSSLNKQADLKETLSDPRVQAGIAGAGVGGLGGLLLGKHKGRDAALGALAGAGVGAGIAHLGRGGNPISDEERAATSKAQAARQTLGVLGADEKKVNKAVGKQQAGEQSEQHTVRDIKHSVPGAISQLKHVPASFGTALEQGRLDDAADQADLAGLKSVVPTSSHFSPGTAALGLGANAAARIGGDYAAARQGDVDSASRLLGGRLHQYAPESVRQHLSEKIPGAVAASGGLTHGEAFKSNLPKTVYDELHNIESGGRSLSATEHGHVEKALANNAPAAAGSKYRRITGGTLPLMAGLAPLLYREWFGRHGYRSGHQPARDLASAVTALGDHKK